MSQPRDHPICTRVNDETWKNLHPKLRDVRLSKDNNKKHTCIEAGKDSAALSPQVPAATSIQNKTEITIAPCFREMKEAVGPHILRRS
ncbi:hypothetical protein M514_05395 [Trichuris suis]|uniref:Uncharacterized protein n=1 Tax=Trichuris suis TaxID=68888 RepID=A0A085NSF6_9BILA|nr:hypothetical protein M513_05395 [Trichuris suis]KFD72402.1 hypothetical protein M514_05395 [Trichuris suis]